jgi:hypothetical protein
MSTSNVKVLFIHHSTGANLIKEGKLRKLLKKINPNIELFDHSYNIYPFLPRLLAKISYHTGLSDEKGRFTGTDYNIELSNNSPKEYAEIFSRKPEDPTLQNILQYDVIAFKNCYPTTKIESDAQLKEYQDYYGIIRDSLKKYPTKKFILFTPPSLREEGTNPENAAKAKQLTQWLTSHEFLKDTPNIFIFDFFSLLADKKGILKKEYCRFIPIDSHPNAKANREIAPIFVSFVSSVVEK